MRKTCLDCVRKHLAQAMILQEESLLGYPQHKWLAIGHLAEASSECVSRFPELANRIRDLRKEYETQDTEFDIMPLLVEIEALSAVTDTKSLDAVTVIETTVCKITVCKKCGYDIEHHYTEKSQCVSFI